MGHDHSHHTGHVHTAPASGALRLAFFINLAFTAIEAIGGWWTDSIAVLTDALHDGGDCLVLGTAWYLQGVAARGRDADYSYGYGRFSMLGGWLTAMVLIAGAIFMLIVSIPRIGTDALPDTTGMMGIAVFGLLMNGFAAWKLHGGGTLNEHGAYLHLLEDVLGWAAVLVGAAVMHFTAWAFVDPLLSIGISIFILYNAVRTLHQGTRIMMQAQPDAIGQDKVREALMTIPEVTGIHDQHTWTLDGTYIIHTVHVVTGQVEAGRCTAIKAEVRSRLTAMGIHHATIEMELPGEPCTLEHH